MNQQSPSWARVNTPADLGRFLRLLRIQQGLTQAELAAELGVSRNYVSEIEAGKPNLYTDRLFSALRLLGGRLRVDKVDT
jgi:HTH-type transcriptional regulator/antitoxin HipB